MESDYDMRATLRVLFNSDFFKESRLNKVKNPTEVVIGALRFVGDTEQPCPEVFDWSNQITYMGQDLLNPPSVEGWHAGPEWINSGSLMKRTNFVAEMVGDVSRPGIRSILDRVKAEASTPEEMVDICLDLMGPLDINENSRKELIDHVEMDGDLSWEGDKGVESEERVAEILQLIVSLREFQFA